MERSRTVVGVDIAKRVFQLHWVERETGELMDLRLTRAKFLEYFANRAPCLIGMEACGGAQHWARRLLALGHEVRLLPAKMVRPFARGNKNDSRDAEAIWTAVQQPGTKTVAVKTEEQQGISSSRSTPPSISFFLITGTLRETPVSRSIVKKTAARIRVVWRHLDTMLYRTGGAGEVPRVRCAEHGVQQVQVPWADAQSRFTARFEAMAIDRLPVASFAAVARQWRLSWGQVAAIQERAVRRGAVSARGGRGSGGRGGRDVVSTAARVRDRRQRADDVGASPAVRGRRALPRGLGRLLGRGGRCRLRARTPRERAG